MSAQPEEIVIREGEAELRLPEAGPLRLPLSKLLEGIRRSGIRGFQEEALPDNVKWRVEGGGATVFVLELKPEIRSVLWIDPKSPAPYGPESRYVRLTVATPFVTLVVPFRRGRIVHHCELFYRNEPLRHLDRDELCFSNLLNVSPHAHGCTAWLCTQFLDQELLETCGRLGRPLGMEDHLHAVAQHAFGGSFNLSSEAHEGKSCFGLTVEAKVDERVTDPRRWQDATRSDPAFILAIPWKGTGMTVRGVVESHLRRLGALRDLSAPGELASLFVAIPKGG